MDRITIHAYPLSSGTHPTRLGVPCDERTAAERLRSAVTVEWRKRATTGEGLADQIAHGRSGAPGGFFNLPALAHEVLSVTRRDGFRRVLRGTAITLLLIAAITLLAVVLRTYLGILRGSVLYL